MKTRIILFATLAGCIAACDKEAVVRESAPEPASSHPVLAAQAGGGLCVDFSYELKTYEISDNPGTTLYECVSPKRDCSKIIPCPTGPGANKRETGNNVAQALREFLQALDKGSIRSYFHSANALTLFPQLEGNELALDMLRSGALEIIRKTDVSGGDLFLAVPKGTKIPSQAHAVIVLNIPAL